MKNAIIVKGMAMVQKTVMRKAEAKKGKPLGRTRGSKKRQQP